ncbi:MAG: STAS domain-containing protein [Acidimicrobiales bacterium]
MSNDVVITQERTEGKAIVKVTGEIDVASAPQLRSELQEVCSGGNPAVAVDLRQVTFLDSSALGVLVGALRRSKENKTELQLIIDSPRLLKIFDITGLTSVFNISDSID